MNKKNRFWKIGILVILIIGLIVGGFLKFGNPFASGGVAYEDPQGRFSMKLDPSWKPVATNGSYSEFTVPDPPMTFYLLVVKAITLEDAYSQVLKTLGFDQGLLQGGGTTVIGDWQAYAKDDTAGFAYGLAGQIVGENAYIFLAKAEKAGVTIENAATQTALTSVKITDKKDIVIKSYSDVEALIKSQVDSLAGSISVAVIYKDQIVYTYAYGEANPIKGIPADTQTIYRFGSMTKPFTATALMQLVEQGKVNLDAWPGEYIPEFPANWKVTVRQLLDHSACMPDEKNLTDGLIARPGESLPPLKQVLTDYINSNPQLICEPGKTSNYANIHFLALARIIEEVSGEPYEKYVVDYVLTPLSMDSTRFQFDEANDRYAKGQYPTASIDVLVSQLNEYRGPGMEGFVLQRGELFSTVDDFRPLPPWGGLLGTPSDVAHFLQMHMNSGRYGDNQILQSKTVAAMQKMQKSTDGSPLGFGLSWEVGKNNFGNYIAHGGGGATIEDVMRFYPARHLGVVVMSSFNGSQASKIADYLASAWVNEN